jgi:hypothetical protein
MKKEVYTICETTMDTLNIEMDHFKYVLSVKIKLMGRAMLLISKSDQFYIFIIIIKI